ncbi:hypothetical protein [Guyparkeria sp.]|uniref:hypothetical protein n=1 Tax=Guyparkeria sp. TaxID=2035736 RepID=UPI003970E1D7
MRLALSVLLFSASMAVYADGQATFTTNNAQVPTMTFTWQDVDRGRLDAPGQPAHVLAIDGKAWGVANVAGRPVTLDLEALANMLGSNNGLANLGPDTIVPTRITALEATGRSETVAGIEGEVYRVSWEDNKGQARIDEAVLTGDPTVREMQAALIKGMARAMARDTGVSTEEGAERELERRGLAVLRFAEDYRLESIRGDRQPDEKFALPGKPLDLQRMMRGLTGG